MCALFLLLPSSLLTYIHRCTENWTCFSCRYVSLTTVTMIYLDVEKHTSFEHNMCVFVWMYRRYVAKVKKILSVCFERYNSAHRCWRILWPAINVKKFHIIWPCFTYESVTEKKDVFRVRFTCRARTRVC